MGNGRMEKGEVLYSIIAQLPLPFQFSLLPIYFYPYVIDAFQYFVLHSMDNFKGIVSRMLYGYGTDGKFGLE